jgi:hypothetical protein
MPEPGNALIRSKCAWGTIDKNPMEGGCNPMRNGSKGFGAAPTGVPDYRRNVDPPVLGRLFSDRGRVVFS